MVSMVDQLILAGTIKKAMSSRDATAGMLCNKRNGDTAACVCGKGRESHTPHDLRDTQTFV